MISARKLYACDELKKKEILIIKEKKKREIRITRQKKEENYLFESSQCVVRFDDFDHV